MKVVAGLLLLLLPLCHGVETSCDGRQNNTECYGALGGSVSIQLVTNVSKTEVYQWSTIKSLILEWRNGIHEAIELKNRSVITDSNGTIRIDNLNREDAGEYQLEIFSDGIRTGPWILQLTIQAPVSSVRLNSECLSQGETRVSCSSEGGDSPQYSWSLNDTQYFPGNDNSSITLERGVSGRLLCSVSNNVSTASKEETISSCVTPDKLTIMAGILSALVFLLVVAIVFVYVHKKRQSNKDQAAEEDEQELTYADVKILKGRQAQQQRAEAEVEYGQIKISNRPRQPADPTGDDCVYAKVRRAT